MQKSVRFDVIGLRHGIERLIIHFLFVGMSTRLTHFIHVEYYE